MNLKERKSLLERPPARHEGRLYDGATFLTDARKDLTETYAEAAALAEVGTDERELCCMDICPYCDDGFPVERVNVHSLQRTFGYGPDYKWMHIVAPIGCKSPEARLKCVASPIRERALQELGRVVRG
jgi:hypothetical protein